MIIEALKDLQNLCQKKPYTKVQVRTTGVLSLVSQLIIYTDKKVRCMTLATLQLLAENDDEAKVYIYILMSSSLYMI